MENIPKEIVNYATSLGFTGQRFAGVVNGVTYYQLYVVKQKQNVTKPRKIGLPVLVRVNRNKIEVINTPKVLRLMKIITTI